MDTLGSTLGSPLAVVVGNLDRLLEDGHRDAVAA